MFPKVVNKMHVRHTAITFLLLHDQFMVCKEFFRVSSTLLLMFQRQGNIIYAQTVHEN